MTSECRETLLGISAYLDGELEAAACAAIEHHCAACPACASVVEDLKKTAGLCRRLGAAPLPSPILERARASVRRLLEDRPANGE
jgi:anti-sigma factor RsiW